MTAAKLKLPARVRRLLRQLARAFVLSHARPTPELELQKLGSEYGGWIVPTALITEDWICYSGGVGEDITFDLHLIERFGCTVNAFDPTPRAITFVRGHASDEPRFRFHPIGLWSENALLRFYAPTDPTHVSHSIVNLQQTSKYFEAQCRSVAAVMDELGHDRIDLFKIDIEGAEHEVIRSMLAAGIHPMVVCMEVDQPVNPWTFLSTIRRVRNSGYQLVAVDNWNFTFVLAQSSAQLARGAG